MTPAIELRALHKSFGATTVIRGIDLSIASGERVALIGPNGAGKSTLFELLSGGTRASGGSILLNGRPIGGLSPHAIRRLGLARSFQTSRLFGRLSVFDNLRCSVLGAQQRQHVFWRFLAGMHDINRRTDTLLQRLGLAAERDTLAMHLSHADQRRLELGLTVAGDADVLLLDEPTAGMSRDETASCIALIRELTEGRTLLLVEHDMAVVFDLADRVAVLVHGELLAFDTPATVRANPRVQAAYLGDAIGSGIDKAAGRAAIDGESTTAAR